jgi:hypothetical protein
MGAAPVADASTIEGWYQQYLGRSANPTEVYYASGYPGGAVGLEQYIATSPEAQAYAKSQTSAPAAATSTSTPPSAASSSSSGNPASPTGDNPYSVAIPSTLATDPAANSFNSSIRSMLLNELTGLSTPISPSDPSIAPALQGYNDQQTRDITDAENQLAEQEYAANGGTGLKSGGFNTQQQKILENADLNKEQFAGNLTYQASQARIQQLQQMLSSAIQFGDTQTAQQIQQSISLLQAQLQSQSLNQSFATSNNDLAFNYANLIAENNREALLLGLQP